MRVAILDCTTTNYTEETAPLLPIGGIERCIINLSRALKNKGLDIRVFKHGAANNSFQGIIWSPFDQPTDFKADVVIACNDPTLFDLYAHSARHKDFHPVLWSHNPLSLWKTLKRGRLPALIRWRPTAVFLGTVQQQETSALLPFRKRVTIAHGVEPEFLNHPVSSTPPPPVAAFISQPYRGLKELVALWKRDISPAMPTARLDIYGAYQTTENLSAYNIHIKGRLPRQQLLNELAEKRVMLIPGHRDETFCLAAIESLCLGIPVVTYGHGSLKERIHHGKTGFIADTPASFAAHTLSLLNDDRLWQSAHTLALAHRLNADWAQRADDWISFFRRLA